MVETVIGLVVPDRSGPSSRPDRAAGVSDEARACWATTPTMLDRVTSVPHDRIGLGEQIAADLLPEAGESCAVEAARGL